MGLNVEEEALLMKLEQSLEKGKRFQFDTRNSSMFLCQF